jgi:hypothetical protein
MKRFFVFLFFSLSFSAFGQNIDIKQLPFAPDSVNWYSLAFAKANNLTQYKSCIGVTPGKRAFFISKNLQYQLLSGTSTVAPGTSYDYDVLRTTGAGNGSNPTLPADFTWDKWTKGDFSVNGRGNRVGVRLGVFDSLAASTTANYGFRDSRIAAANVNAPGTFAYLDENGQVAGVGGSGQTVGFEIARDLSNEVGVFGVKEQNAYFDFSTKSLKLNGYTSSRNDAGSPTDIASFNNATGGVERHGIYELKDSLGIKQPSGQVVMGSGTGVTSSTNLTYESNTLTVNGGSSSVVDNETLLLKTTGENGSSISFDNSFGDIAEITGTKYDSGGGADDGKILIKTATNSVLSTKAIISDLGITTSYRIGIGIEGANSPLARLHVEDTMRTSNQDNVIINSWQKVPTSGSIDCFGISSQSTRHFIPAGVTNAAGMCAITGDAYNAAPSFAGTQTYQMGLRGRAGIVDCTAGSVVTSAYGGYFEIRNEAAAGKMTNAYGVFINNSNTVGTITNRYDLYASSANAKNFFAGKVGINKTNATNWLQVQGAGSSVSDETTVELLQNGENGSSIDIKNAFGGLVKITGTKLGAGADADDGFFKIGIATNSVISDELLLTKQYFGVTSLSGVGNRIAYLNSAGRFLPTNIDPSTIITSLSGVGSTPNANAATLFASTLNLEPASASFPGVVTTAAQTFSGQKTINMASSGAVTQNLILDNTATAAVSSATSMAQSVAGTQRGEIRTTLTEIVGGGADYAKVEIKAQNGGALKNAVTAEAKNAGVDNVSIWADSDGALTTARRFVVPYSNIPLTGNVTIPAGYSAYVLTGTQILTDVWTITMPPSADMLDGEIITITNSVPGVTGATLQLTANSGQTLLGFTGTIGFANGNGATDRKAIELMFKSGGTWIVRAQANY